MTNSPHTEMRLSVFARHDSVGHVIDYVVLSGMDHGNDFLGSITVEGVQRDKDGAWRMRYYTHTNEWPQRHHAHFTDFNEAVQFIALRYT